MLVPMVFVTEEADVRQLVAPAVGHVAPVVGLTLLGGHRAARLLTVAIAQVEDLAHPGGQRP
jgi:hypothetical protein